MAYFSVQWNSISGLLKAGIKPIIGCEAYIVTKGSRFEKTVDTNRLSKGQGRGIYNHIVLLAKNALGYKNLMRLCTLGHTEGYYFKPRIDVEILSQYREGLIATSACPAGIVGEQLLNGNYTEALEYASIYHEIFSAMISTLKFRIMVCKANKQFFQVRRRLRMNLVSNL